jgi:predicted Fe-S protein YdhL (DUF1289 family)
MNDDDRAFLEHFPANQRSTVSNLFLRQVRDGRTSPDSVRAGVYAEMRQRLEGPRWHSYDDSKDRAILAALQTHYDDSVAYAGWCIAYEKLTPDEKQRWKNNRTTKVLVEVPYTEKQEKYLRALGYHGPIDSLKHASALIEIYKRGGRVEIHGAA